MNRIFYTVVTLIIILALLTGCSAEENQQKTPLLVENPLPLGPSDNGGDTSSSPDASAEDSDTASEDSNTDSQDKSSPFLDINIPAADSGDQNEENKASEDEGKKSDSDLVDLTVLSSTMVYAEVYNMMSYPEDYMGKTIKMIGLYYPGYFEETKKTYHFAVISDAAACCSQGIEFMWNGEHKYPDDYPAEGSIIVVTGIFSSYKEGEETYYYVAADEINKK